MELANKALQMVKENTPLRLKLSLELGVASVTMDRYIKNNDVMLTTESALRLIEKELGLSRSEILAKK